MEEGKRAQTQVIVLISIVILGSCLGNLSQTALNAMFSGMAADFGVQMELAVFIDFTLSSLLFKKRCVDRLNAVLPFPDSFDILDIGNTCLSCPAFLFPLHFLGGFHKPADSSD